MLLVLGMDKPCMWVCGQASGLLGHGACIFLKLAPLLLGLQGLLYSP